MMNSSEICIKNLLSAKITRRKSEKRIVMRFSLASYFIILGTCFTHYTHNKANN